MRSKWRPLPSRRQRLSRSPFDGGGPSAYPQQVMRSLRLLYAPSAALLLSGVFGCTAAVVEAAPDGGSAATTQALILVERAEREGKSAQTNISAKFLKAPVAADSDEVERIIGSELELPAVGKCLIVSSSEEAILDPNAAGSIELFDVGDVTIRTSSGAIRLAARAFPDVGDRVSGMFYTSPDSARDLPAPGKYFLESSGSLTVDRFVIETDAPAAPANVVLGGRVLAEGLEIRTDAQLDVAWIPDAASPASSDDVAYIEIVAENGVATRCAFEDRGRATLPSSLLRDSAFAPLPMMATFSVHRVRQGAFQVSGIDAGEVRFNTSVTAGVVLLPSSDRMVDSPAPREPIASGSRNNR